MTTASMDASGVLEHRMQEVLDLWQQDWSIKELFGRIDDTAKIAFAFGTLNDQVHKNGFEGWADNGLYTPETATTILVTLDSIGAEEDGTAKQLKELMLDVVGVFNDFEWDFDKREFSADLEDDEEDCDAQVKRAQQALDKLTSRYLSEIGQDKILPMVNDHVVRGIRRMGIQALTGGRAPEVTLEA